MRTEPPTAPIAYGPSQPAVQTGFIPIATWITHKSQIQFGLAIVAYLMVLVGSVIAVSAVVYRVLEEPANRLLRGRRTAPIGK